MKLPQGVDSANPTACFTCLLAVATDAGHVDSGADERSERARVDFHLIEHANFAT
ncbi:hypothetical protein [Burkholderia ubonensis]|uniref:hypothetical protein n=1 Tax=Burkholderia ubonensis TaxID=101571 RepID=UPI0012F7E0EB|nr:hypothetical protein [Burkholderia ubonensis]